MERSNGRTSSDWYTNLTTDTFAAATLLYLDVVVSGAYPAIPSIRGGVWNTTRALRRLVHAKLLRRLAWPICVAASLADGQCLKLYQRFERGVSGDDVAETPVKRALIIARKCRQLRDQCTQSSQSCDWFGAVDSLDQVWILI